VHAVNQCRPAYTYLFTTGGIGPTHDDITSAAIAKAFGVPLQRHAGAEAVLEKHYGRELLNEARLKMADIPLGAEMVANPVSAAPGFRMENVYVFAGVPVIMRAMFDHVRGELRGGPPVLARTINVSVTEGTFAGALADIQRDHSEVEIGSYPFIRQGKLGASIVARSADPEKLAAAEHSIRAFFTALDALLPE